MRNIIRILLVISAIAVVCVIERKETEKPSMGKGWSVLYDYRLKKTVKAVDTLPFTSHIRGYTGPIDLRIKADENGKISDIEILSHEESPEFIKRIKEEGLLDKLDGIYWKDAGSKKIDAVSGVTLSSKAVLDSIKYRLSIIEEEQKILLKPDIDFFALAIIALSLYICLRPVRHERIIRKAVLFLSMIYLGFIKGAFLSMALFSGWISFGIAWKSVTLWVMAFLAVLVPLITRKKFYCYFLCPFGAAEELVFNISKWRWHVPAKAGRYISYVRYLLLVIIALVIIFDIRTDPAKFEPFTFFLIRSADIFVIILASVFLLLSFLIYRPWCRFFCPTGALLDLFRR